ncbi:MAG TPA: hypothetical protein VNX47_11285 [Nevskia sp.]|jgi:hypothetical protein|nr:hypothetical protein [Nevskia sp.]
MKLTVMLLAATLPLSACVIEPDHDRDHDRVYVDRDHHDDHDRDHCDRDGHCEHDRNHDQ